MAGRGWPGGSALGAGTDDEHADLGAVRRGERHLAGAHVWHPDRAGRLGPEGDLAAARVVTVDHRRRGVVGVAEPGLVPAFRPGADAAGGAQPRGATRVAGTGQRQRAGPFTGGQIVHGDLADRVPGPGGDQYRPSEPGAVQDGVVAEDRRRILADEVTPAGRLRVGRIGHRQPAPRRARIGEHVQPAVPAHVQAGPGVHALLDHLQHRLTRRGGGQVGQPDIVARRRALGGGDHQPAAVVADRDAVVVRLVPAAAEDQRVLIGGRADRVQVDPAVKLLFTRRDLARRERADVVERLTTGQPGHRRVAAAADGAVHELTGHDIQHPEFRLLVPSAGQLVGEQPALPVRVPGIERGHPGRVQRRRVDQHPLRLPGGGRQQHPMLLPGQAAHEELARTPPGRGADVPGGHQLLDPGLQPGPPGQPGPRAGPQRVLRRQPLLRAGAGRVLQPAVRVGHTVPVHHLGEVVAARRGIPGRLRAALVAGELEAVMVAP